MAVVRSFVAILCSLFAACALLGPADPGDLLNQRITEPYVGNVKLPIFFATNRRGASGNADCSDRAFGVAAADSVRYGICEVGTPKRRPVGAIESSADRFANDDRFYKMDRYTGLDAEQFFAAIAARPERDVLIFVHGFNVRFEEAVYRTAQLAYDVKFQGVASVFTWPAGAGDEAFSEVMMMRTYAANRANAERARPLFADHLRRLRATGKIVHVLVHSMGHQVALPAIADLTQRGENPRLGELILNAPDFSSDQFAALAPTLRNSARRITLYCSPGDNALEASRRVNNNYRIGLCKRTPGVDVINVNEVDNPALGLGGLGHGYYSGRETLTDVWQTLLGVEVSRRLFIRRSDPGGGEDWILRR
jgi:esterase/lipase superfamily enzyme